MKFCTEHNLLKQVNSSKTTKQNVQIRKFLIFFYFVFRLIIRNIFCKFCVIVSIVCRFGCCSFCYTKSCTWTSSSRCSSSTILLFSSICLFCLQCLPICLHLWRILLLKLFKLSMLL